MANFTLNSDNNRQPGSANADLIDGRDDNDTLTGLPQLSIKGMTLTEGHGGASLATFTLRLSKPALSRQSGSSRKDTSPRFPCFRFQR